MQITVYGPLRSATGEKTIELEFAGETTADALEAFVDAYPRARSQLYTEEASLRPSVRVIVDGDRATLDDPCPDDASITLHPAMQGG